METQVIQNRGGKDLMENLCILTGAVSYQLKNLYPVETSTYYHLLYKLKQEDRIKSKCSARQGRDKYFIPTELLKIEKEELLTVSNLKGYIERGEWGKLEVKSKGRQIALLSGAETEGVRMIYETDRFHHYKREEKLMEGLVGKPPNKEGEGRILNPDILERIKNHDHSYGLFITSTELVEWLKNTTLFEDEKSNRRLGYSKASGWLLTAAKDLYAVYIIDDIKTHKVKTDIERAVRMHVFEGQLHMELKALFITTGGVRDKELLAKKKRRDQDKKINPKLVRPEIIYNSYEVLDISEGAEIQKITGKIPSE